LKNGKTKNKFYFGEAGEVEDDESQQNRTSSGPGYTVKIMIKELA
jgi:hypothetical protein